jgi:hypothetical protein
MPTRKQRRRRQKAHRHEYEYVLVDEEGNVVDAEPGDEPPQKDAPKSAKTEAQPRAVATKRQTPARGMREIKPASWRRVVRRGVIIAPLMFVVVSILDSRLTPVQHATQTLFLLAFFLPFSYVMDVVAYRMYVKRTAQSQPATDAKSRAAKAQPRRSPR